MTQQRQFTRLPFRSSSTLTPETAPGGAVPTELIDISLKGALVAKPASLELEVGTPVTLTIALEGSPLVISMRTAVAHTSGRRLGLECTAIDVESITHLRRLLELNLGDPGLLDRELLNLG